MEDGVDLVHYGVQTRTSCTYGQTCGGLYQLNSPGRHVSIQNHLWVFATVAFVYRPICNCSCFFVVQPHKHYKTDRYAVTDVYCRYTVTDVYCMLYMLLHGRWKMNEDKLSSYTNLKVTSTVHISQSTYLEAMFHNYCKSITLQWILFLYNVWKTTEREW